MIDSIIKLPSSEILVDLSKVSAVGSSFFVVDGIQIGSMREGDIQFLVRAVRGYRSAVGGDLKGGGGVISNKVAAYVGNVGIDGLQYVGCLGVLKGVETFQFELLGVEGKFELVLQWG